ncbi:MAG: hypothetical protein HRT68_07955 [Flavobacteriaceae bacterium]|nr:hypothetical protein [Flavobacteriaceae bacterium]
MIRFSVVLFTLMMLFSCKNENTSTTPNNPISKEKEIVEDISTNQEKLTPTKELAILGEYSKPLANKLNSDFVLSDLGGDKLYIYKDGADTPPKLITETKNIGNDFAWSKDGNSILFKERTKDYRTQIVSFNTKTLEREIIPDLPRLVSIKAMAITDTIYYLDNKTLAVKAKYDNKVWDISKEPGNYYNIEVAPNNQYLIAHKGPSIYLFTTEGKFLRKLGEGIATGWHPNSQYIIGFKDSSVDGHSITGSELYLFHLEKETVQITDTPDQIETWPSFEGTKKVVFRDEERNGIFSKNIEAFIK